ncbi:MAG: UDP-N-acetylmuramoyl-L-alanine--D-glutamate ligase [Proteobacteria bacterium]|nr:UDP-N-acetylmuramoyl-L-alanine--D-glutamate ligase [Pseudomonadota bacterium]
MPMPNQNKVTVVGLGKTGFSCVEFLVRQGIPVAVTDSRSNPPYLAELQSKYPEVIHKLGVFDSDLLLSAEKILLSPGISLEEPAIEEAIKKGIPVIGDVEFFAQHVNAPVIAITGTNGKSTVTALVGEMVRASGLKAQVGGNLGTPALDLLQKVPPDFYVLELSSFQLETIESLRPKTATILNITPDHLDRYPSIKEYAEAKHRIYHHAEWDIYNRDDLQTKPKENHKSISFGFSEPKEKELGIRIQSGIPYLAYGNKNLLPVTEMILKGKHNWANALAAIGLGLKAGISEDGIIKALKSFPGLSHRCQWIRELNGVQWVNDSKGTNVVASCAAINGLSETVKGKIILIAGGLSKEDDFSDLANAVEKYGRAVVLIGRDAEKIAAGLKPETQKQFAKTMEEAINISKDLAKPGDIVLLSPVCASFDMFRDYQHRGDVFTQLVQGLK